MGAAVEITTPGGTAHAVSRRGTVSVTTGVASGTRYAGSYEVTPGAGAQVLPTALCTMERDVTVAPIPSNYGLVEWDGSTLTIS